MEVTLKIEFGDDVKNFIANLLNGDGNASKKPAGRQPAKAPKKDADEDLLDDEDAFTGDDEPIYTQERVREKCQQLIADGKAPKLKKLLEDFGYAKVAQLQPDDFNDFMNKANKIK